MGRRDPFEKVFRGFSYGPFSDKMFITFINLKKNYNFFSIIREIHLGIWNNLIYLIKRVLPGKEC